MTINKNKLKETYDFIATFPKFDSDLLPIELYFMSIETYEGLKYSYLCNALIFGQDNNFNDDGYFDNNGELIYGQNIIRDVLDYYTKEEEYKLCEKLKVVLDNYNSRYIKF